MKDNYYSLAKKISIVGIVVNIILGVLKLVVGIVTNSIAIIADAFHSFSDLITTFVVIVSLHLSTKPADKRHPFGHGRVEDIGGLLVSFILGFVGLRFLKTSFMRLFNPERVVITEGVIAVIFVTALVKLFLGIYTSVSSKKINSFILHADALHHYSDFFTSLIVSAGLLFVWRGKLKFDCYLGVFVAFVILFWAIKMAKEFIDNLIGKELSPETYNKIKDTVFSFPNVEGIHNINIHSYGHRKIISFHIVVERDLSLEEAHRLADSIEKRLVNEGWDNCIVHVDIARNSFHFRRSSIEKVIVRLVRRVSFLKGFHNLEVITTETDNILNFHLLIDKNVSLEESHAISHRISNLLKKKFSLSQVHIHVEPYLKKRGYI